ncbi:SDR family NAD(P)-dependent oxidoreductase [Paenibacillus albiflavus]|uniref:SDR family NAD(P)-dependent oxidoreductase n=1 Tax=Paenibacillus albiflavus TaxID=2545760 RepID=A0A4R4EG70_9BACL|nr:SDR family NAD(P)-dependent oxidoreductase [Paenibacillus albiflavus]TCZ78120.1 SDR family NAD(P)-dependent oxidoreductase [Paenibacillus albiflavus]
MKYTVVTGASSGIGYETALAFAARGKNLIIAARRKEQLEELKSEITRIYPDVDVVIREIDLSVSENAYKFYESLQGLHIETWINNAGFGNFATVSQQNLDKISAMLHLNIEALTILSSLYVREYSNVEGTQLINVSSGGGYTIIGNAITYCATKFYVSAFTEGLSHELNSQGALLQAKVLAPAATETEFAKRSFDVSEFEYHGTVPKFHTAKEMARFMLDLYDSDRVVGIVNGLTYEFQLRDTIFNYVASTR